MNIVLRLVIVNVCFYPLRRNCTPKKIKHVWYAISKLSQSLGHDIFVSVEHNPEAGSCKGVDVTFHVMRYYPRFTVIDDDGLN